MSLYHLHEAALSPERIQIKLPTLEATAFSASSQRCRFTVAGISDLTQRSSPRGVAVHGQLGWWCVLPGFPMMVGAPSLLLRCWMA